MTTHPISAITGLPAIVVPAGLSPEGLPVSIELVGHPWSERRLVELAHAYEHATRRRVVPKLTPTLAGEVIRTGRP